MHRLSVLATFIIEIPLTFLFFAPTSALRKMTFFCQVLNSTNFATPMFVVTLHILENFLLISVFYNKSLTKIFG